jgi:hypothetical protein
LEMPGLSEEIKTAAQKRRVRVKMRHERAQKEDNPQ